MAVLGRVLIGSSERLDLADLLSVDSFTTSDFKYLLQSFVGGTVPYVLAGCEVDNPGSAIGTESVAINIHDSVIYSPSSSAGPFFYGLEEGHEYAAPLVPELRKNATNFIYLTFTTFDTAQDSRAFWDPDADGGEGSEFSQDVNTESVLSVAVGVSVATFPEGTIPICKVEVDASVITSIQDCRNMLFRLGGGGVSPNPFGDYEFRSLPNSSYQRSEPSTSMNSTAAPNCFQGGDKNIFTMKEWMDVVMTKLKELGSTTYWYESASGSGGGSGGGASISTNFLKSKGKWIHSDSDPTGVEFTEDIQSINLVDPRTLIFRATAKNLQDEEVLYADLLSGDINDGNVFAQWFNSASFVDGPEGSFANIVKGDWIKKKTDTADKWVRVEEFKNGSGGSGTVVAPVNAISVIISRPYEGIDSTIGVGDATEYTKGVFLSTELQIANRGSAALQSLSGDFFWLAARSDVIHDVSQLSSTTLSIDTISEADGVRARCYVAAGHGLYDGYRITIDGASAYAGTFKVEVEDSNVFYITTAVTGDESSVDAYWGMVTCIERSSHATSGYGIELESATHNLEDDQSITISGTTSYDGAYAICVPPSAVADNTTKIQIPMAAPQATESDGLATLPRMNVRDEFGITKIVQGQSSDIGDGTTDAVKAYIGMANSMSGDKPDYITSASGYNAKDGMSDYNCDPDDDLTTRAAKLTAMMADRVQDRSLIFDGITTITNTGGTDITASATLDLIKPGSDTQTITLTTSSIVANSAIVATMDRNNSTAISTSVETLDNAFLLEENKLVLFYRLGTTDIYTWEGVKIPAGETHTYGERLRPRAYTEQDRNAKLVAGGTWSWDANLAQLSWTSSAYIQLPGLLDSVNTINFSNITLNTSEVAYVELNRAAPGGALTVQKSTSNALVPTEDTLIIARRVDNYVIVCDTFRLNDREYLKIDDALGEINRHHGQLKIEQTNATGVDEVEISAADIAMLDSTTLSQEISSFVMEWAGATINFSTGVVSGISDDIAVPHLVADEYFWYGIGMIPDSVSSDNRMISKLLISKAGNGDTVLADAPLPLITGTKKLGSVLVKVNAGGTAVEVVDIRRLGVGAGGSGGSGIVKADLYEPIATTFPTGTSVTIDGQAGVNGDLVLFSSLTNAADNNRIYELSGVGSSLVWSPWPSFDGLFDPVDGDRVGFTRGDAYAEQMAVFNGTGFTINDIVRFFDGESGTDFWELGSIKTSTLSDNVTDTEIFSVNATGTENIIVSYSIMRGANKQVGEILLTHDGTNTSIATTGADIGSCGITFNSDIDSGDIRLLYTSTSTGSTATMKYFLKRWSDSPGGPTGVPNYSSASGGSETPAAGSAGDIQIKGGTGNLDADSRFNWDTAAGVLNMNGLHISPLSSPVVLSDNQALEAPIVTFTATDNKFLIFEYSLERNGEMQLGQIRLVNNGTISSLTDDFANTASSLGITFSADISGTDVRLLYTSTSTGNNASFKYALRQWN